ncbi:MAG: AmmeMemoRadiSam system protein B [Gammaproteobacteria bacterium]
MSLSNNHALPEGIRPPAVAGMFYPADAGELRHAVSELLREAAADTTDGPLPKAIIAPHAGYIYSGSTAARAYARLAAIRDRIKRVILLGPAHRVAMRGIALTAHRQFATPLGGIDIDQAAAELIRPLPQVQVLEAAHEQEHSLEVQLPFLQMSLGQFSLLPLVVGDTAPEQVKQVLECLWGGSETLIVISSDLSHYHDYDTARQLDQDTSAAIQALQVEKIGSQQACGCMPLCGLLTLAREQGMQIDILQTLNSGDTAGDRERVVGYGAYALYEKRG